jgi:septum formation protein
MKQLILASQSPRRAKILESLGVSFSIVKTDSEEIDYPEDPERTVSENAVLKLKACQKEYPSSAILAADTIVWFNGEIYGKPRDLNEAKSMLQKLSANTHTVFTGVAFTDGETKEIKTQVCRSEVVFRSLSESAIEEYVERTKPTDRAGAYDIDENGDMLVERYEGEYENIMGLPVLPLENWILRPLEEWG